MFGVRGFKVLKKCLNLTALSISHKSLWTGQQLDPTQPDLLCHISSQSKVHSVQRSHYSISQRVTFRLHHFSWSSHWSSGWLTLSNAPSIILSYEQLQVCLWLRPISNSRPGPVWPSRSETRQVWNLTAALSSAEASSAQQGNKTRRVRAGKLLLAKILTQI